MKSVREIREERHFNKARKKWNREADSEIKRLINDDFKKLIVDVGKNASGKTTRYLKYFKEYNDNIAFVVNNHIHGKEKREELQSRYPKFNSFAYLQGFENACPKFLTIDEKGNQIVNKEMLEQAEIFRNLGRKPGEIHKEMHGDGYERCEYNSQWAKFKILSIKKAMLSQTMLSAIGTRDVTFRTLVFDEVDGLLGFRDEIIANELDNELKFESPDPEPLEFILNKNRRAVIPIRKIDQVWGETIRVKVEKLQSKLKDKSIPEILKDGNYTELVRNLELLEYVDNQFVIVGENKFGVKVYRDFPMLTKILKSLAQTQKATRDSQGNIISGIADANKIELEITPTIIIASARMRDNFIMKLQLEVCFELAKRIVKDEVEKEQIQHIWDNLAYYPEVTSKDDFPKVRKTIAYFADPKESLSDRKLSHDSKLFPSFLIKLVKIRKRFLEEKGKLYGLDETTPFLLNTKKEFSEWLAREPKIAVKGKGFYKAVQSFYKINLRSSQIMHKHYGGISAGTNPPKEIKYIILFGDWINGEYTSLTQYLYYDDPQYGSSYHYSDCLAVNKHGITVKPLTPELIRRDIFEIIGLEFKEYILGSRYERPVLAITHLATAYKDRTVYFQDLFSKFNIEMRIFDSGL